MRARPSAASLASPLAPRVASARENPRAAFDQWSKAARRYSMLRSPRSIRACGRRGRWRSDIDIDGILFGIVFGIVIGDRVEIDID